MIINIFKKYDFYFALICISFSITKLFSFELTHNFIRLIIFPLLLFFYLREKINVNKFFLCFLILFGLAEVFVFYNTLAIEYKEFYIIPNASFILGYLFLIALIVSNLNLKQLLKRFPIQILVLSALGIYLIFEFNSMVLIIEGSHLSIIDYSINILYNVLIVVVLSLSLLNYLYHDSKLDVKLLVACCALIFSEFFQTVLFNKDIPKFLYKIIDNTYIVILSISYFAFFIYIKSNKIKGHI